MLLLALPGAPVEAAAWAAAAWAATTGELAAAAAWAAMAAADGKVAATPNCWAAVASE